MTSKNKKLLYIYLFIVILPVIIGFVSAYLSNNENFGRGITAISLYAFTVACFGCLLMVYYNIDNEKHKNIWNITTIFTGIIVVIMMGLSYFASHGTLF
jgi:heme/copper-type cytochrome/quinol oxidase subunit 4